MAIPLAIHPKTELRRIIKRFLQDKNRGISIPLFAELAGLSTSHIRDVFLNESEPMTEYVQRRVSKAYQEWIKGEVAIMQNRDTSLFVQYRKEAKPILHKSSKLTLINGEIKINMGIKPKYDYSDLTLDEQLKGI
jgi:AraC-like DNA-binding protein